MADTLDPQLVTRCLVFAVALAALFVGHQLGDHVLQTDRQAEGKVSPGAAGARAMAGHLLGYHLTATVVLLGTTAVLGLPLSVAGLCAGLAFSVVTHGLLDRRWPVRRLLRATGSREFADVTTPICGMYVADQALHHACLLVCALLIAGL